MSKTFKSVNADVKEDLLVVLGVDEGVNIHTESPVDRCGVSIAPSDAPALALAILEAAGYESANTGGVITGARQAVSALEKHIEIEARHAAEALEQAELEAEALDYWKAYNRAVDPANFDDLQWGDLMPETQAKWLAVARKAREIGAKK